MFSVLIGFVLSTRCLPCMPWPPNSRQACPMVCKEVSEEQYEIIMKKYQERVKEYYSGKKINPLLNSDLIQEKPIKCYHSHCYISISNPKVKKCTRDCISKPGKITYIK